MKGSSLLVFLVLWSSVLCAKNDIYSKTYGQKKDIPLIFFHGGPGGNSSAFEYTVARELSAKGFYVIVYDQKGCGRSATGEAIDYSLEGYLKDIDSLYLKYHISKAVLLGHSWGGTLACFYADRHPDKVSKLILASSPVSYPAVFRTIRDHCWEYYDDKGDVNGMQQMLEIRDMDTSSMKYISSVFEQAFYCGLYQPKQPNVQAKELYNNLPDPVKNMVNNYSSAPVSAICRDIGFTSLELSGMLSSVLSKNIPVYGIYGDEDGLFDEAHKNDLEVMVGKKHMFIIRQASHNIFLDKREEFINVVEQIGKAN